ncbi:MAG TPA: ACP S-malonyltransferase [candidate division Zixibacteria bacterium]|nr:ACP S-malonyltransferase [candidate division Zixibacteria bacterium]
MATERRPRAVIACPGRGSYTSASLGSLPADDPLVRRAEELRAGYGLEPLLALDGAERFDPPRHLRPANASPLILLATMLDVEQALADHEVVAVIGNSLGWYTALAISGALPFDDAFRLVQEMALLQEEPLPEGGPGGQLIYPLTDADWRPDPELRAAVADALADGDGDGDGAVYESIDLGGYAVLAGDEAGIARLTRRLPPVRVGERAYPLRLALHGPYHTPLVAHVAAAARERLTDLSWQAPAWTLIDGRGARWTPWSTDPLALRDYTLGVQVTSPYRFATSLRVALREYAPDVVVLPGPGNTLGGICGQVVVAEGYRGIRSRAAFEAAQRQGSPVVLSMRR